MIVSKGAYTVKLSQRAIACLLACTVAAANAGCTSMKTIHPATTPNQPVYGPVKAGDTVIVQTPDGERWRFVVQAIDGNAIVAPEGKRYERADVVRLQRKAFSGPRTIGLVAGIRRPQESTGEAAQGWRKLGRHRRFQVEKLAIGLGTLFLSTTQRAEPLHLRRSGVPRRLC